MLPFDYSLANNPAGMASPDHQGAQNQPLQHQQLQQHNPQAHELDLKSDFATEGSVSTQPRPLLQTLGSDSSHRPSSTYASLTQFHQRPGHQHPSAADAQLPSFLPQAVDNVDSRMAVASRPPHVDSDYGVKDTQACMEMDRASIIPSERPEWEEANAVEGLEAQGRAEWCQVDVLMYEQQSKVPGSDESLDEMRMEQEIGHGENKKEAIFPKENTPKDLEKAEQLIPIRVELEFENYRLSETFEWNANDLALSPETFAVITCLNFGIPLTARPLIIKQVQDQLAEHRVRPGRNVPSAPTGSTKEQPSSIIGRKNREAEGNDNAWWRAWRERLRTGGASESIASANGSADQNLRHQESSVSFNKGDSEVIDMGAEPMKNLVSMPPLRILIKLDIAVGSMRLVDQFEWDTSVELSSPESFAECYTSELGLGGKFKTAIALGIRRQVQMYRRSLLSLNHPFDRSVIQDEGLCPTVVNPVAAAIRDAKQGTAPIPILYRLEIDHQAELKKDNFEAVMGCGIDVRGWEPIEANKALPSNVDIRLSTAPTIQQVDLRSGRLNKLAAQEHDQVTPQLVTLIQPGSTSTMPSPVVQHNTKNWTSSATYPPSARIEVPPEPFNPPVSHELGPAGWQCTTCGPPNIAIINDKGPKCPKSRCIHETSYSDESLGGSDPGGSMSPSVETGLKKTPLPQAPTPGKRTFITPWSPGNVSSPTGLNNLEGGESDSDGYDEIASLLTHADDLEMRFMEKGDFGDLDNVILHHHLVLDVCPPGHPLQSTSMSNLANALLIRFQQRGDSGDLDSTIMYHHQALEMHPPGHPGHSSTLSNLASALLTRFQQNGDFGDLDSAIMYHHQALDPHLPDHPGHSSTLNNLANALLARFEQKGDLRNLETAIMHYYQALDPHLPSHLPSHPSHSSTLNNLASALLTMFQQKGDFGDLENAIMYYHQALDMHPSGHPGHSSALNNLASAVLTRFEQKGDLGDLDSAIMYHNQALDLHPPGHPGRSSSLSNLANALLIRLKQSGDLGDLNSTITYHYQALELHPPGYPGHSLTLNNLASALFTRFEQGGDFGDLDIAIMYHCQALDLCPPGHSGHSSSIYNLGLALQTRFQLRGDIKDLNDAISLYDNTCAIPPHHPDQLSLSQGLAKAYLLHPNVQHNLDESFSLYQKAANHVPGGSKAQLLVSLDWINSAKQHLHTSEILAYSTSLGLLHKYLTLHPTILSQLSALTRVPLTLGSDAAACAINENQLDTAVEFLEQGRAMLWRNLEGYGTSLQNLQDRGHQDLAQEFQRLGHLLEHTTLSSMGATQQSERSVDEQAHRYHQLSQDWDHVIAQVQNLPGFSHFLKPIPFQTLQLSASKGPVIVINVSKYHTDAIILSNNHDPTPVSLPFATLTAILHLSNTLKKILRKSQEEGSSEHAKRFTSVLRSLWSWVVEPIVAHLDWLPAHSHIWWCPTSALCSLPLHAAGPWRKGKPNLSDIFLSSYTPTLSAFQRAQVSSRTPNATPTFLAVGVPELSGGLRKLESIGEELQVMTQLAGSKGQHVDVLDGEDACKDVVLAELRQHSWIHFACHGHQDFNEPFKSSFSLYNMPLTLHDIIQAKIPNAELAFLSACHSASADQVAPDETIHLAAALQYSGFKTVIGTLWAMDDRDGPDVARSFYEYMFRNGKERLDHKDAAQALKHVVDTLRKKGVPFNRWACFVHIGA